MTWTQTLPVALAALAVLYIPGALVLRALPARGLVALAGAPAVTFGALGAVAIGLSAVGVPWSPLSVGLVLVALLAVGVAVTWKMRTREAPAEDGGRWWAVAVAGSAAVGFLVQALPLKAGMIHPGALLQAWDAPFHYSAIEIVRDFGDASPFGGLDPLYGDSAQSVFYPSLWHAVAGLLPGPAVLVANVMLFVALGTWMLGVAALARVCFPSLPAVAVVAPLVAGASTAYPSVMIRMSQYPLTVAVALVPGVLALVAHVVLGRRSSRRARGGLARPATILVLLGLAALGLFAVHTSALVAVAFALAPLVLLQVATVVRSLARAGRGVAAAAVAAGSVAVAAAAVWSVLSTERLRSMMGFERDVTAVGASVRNALLMDSFGPADPLVNLPLAVAGGIGLVVALTRRSSRWLALAWALFLAVYVVAYLPAGPWKLLSAFWYNEGSRVQAVADTLWAPLVAVGVCFVGSLLVYLVPGRARTAPRRARTAQGGWRAVTAGVLAVVLGIGCFLVSGGFRAEEKSQFWIAPYFVPDAMAARGAYASDEEVAMLWRLRQTLPADAVVVGDPFNGAAFVPAVTGRRAVPPHVSGGSARAADAQYLLQHFRDVGEDPAVCAAIGRLGVTHVYLDAPITIYGWDLAQSNPGMYGVDTAGFERVDAGGTASVWKITSCGGF
ncbi:hypothetical protein KZX45_14545 [Georgenia sp. EYE_87]|uniref:DUF6541 family protein n=1 Tax=Georgenia sp. EYE_87 TaxID=2853448 RepID=UPI00200507B7|nr:DUF6541 family protein [Georgenia sp. EYE_87]MCK6211766.1 hypothetical protein [Georgenia sp. EYE_87]